MPPFRRSRLSPLVPALPLLLLAGVAFAQIPGLPNVTPQKSEAPAKAEASESFEQTRARIRKQFDEAREQSQRPPIPVPVGIESREVTELREAQLKLVAAYEIQLRTLDQLERARSAKAAAELRERSWTGFETPPPYTMFRVDELRDQADVARERIGLLEGGVARLKADSERTQAELQQTEADARLADEALGSASTSEQKARAAWRLGLASASGRAAAAAAGAVSLVAKFRGDDLAARRAELQLLGRQISVASESATLTEADVATARKSLDAKVADARSQLAAVDAQTATRDRERDAAKQALAKVRADSRVKPADAAAAQARLDAAEAWIEAARDQTDALQGLIVIENLMAASWGARYTVLHSTDPEARRATGAKLRESAQRNAGWRTYTESLVRDGRAKLGDIESRLTDAGVAPAELRYVQDALVARRSTVIARERLQNELDDSVRELDRWVADLDSARRDRGLRERLIDGWTALRDGARWVWNFELFEVEDTTVADGQTISVSRGVTVGKSVGAVLIFLLGYWFVAAIARRIARSLVTRGWDAPRVRTAKRWTLALVAVLLLLLTLNVARIPFTVFAFLGGALAIGVGFGTQTLIKNLVSGIVVLMERKVRVGDIVEVENFSGTVTEVNLRSSTIRGFDGLEAIVPNAVLVENKVTNWTQSDRRVRRVVKVGVAYGSPVRDVADLLQACAKRHGLVLADPAPLVIFEDFGDNALVFALYVWVELRPNVNAAQVLSDIRFMIEKSFAEAGIVIAYPQRDVNFNPASPLRVEVVRKPKHDESGPT